MRKEPHSVAIALIKNGIGGRKGFIPEGYYEPIDPEWPARPKGAVLFKIVVVEEGGEF